MDVLDNQRETTQELVSFARQRGYDFEAIRNDIAFQRGRRSIMVWRKRDALPFTGRPEETEGTLKYNMQGAISRVPSRYRASADVFRGAWSEAGTFASIEEAFELVKAWLLEGKEVDDLPEREMRRESI